MDALDLVQFYWHDYGVEKYVGAAQRLQVLPVQDGAVFLTSRLFCSQHLS